MLVEKIEISFVELRRSGMLKKLKSSEQLWWKHQPIKAFTLVATTR
jgi:hypothetical protein